MFDKATHKLHIGLQRATDLWLRIRWCTSLTPPRLLHLPLPQVCNPDELLHFLSNYLTELSLLDYSMLVFLPSVVAASGVYLANLMLERHPWDANLQHYSDYAPSDIKLCVTALAAVHQAVSNSQQLPAIREKYGHPRFQQVSKIPPVSLSACIFA